MIADGSKVFSSRQHSILINYYGGGQKAFICTSENSLYVKDNTVYYLLDWYLSTDYRILLLVCQFLKHNEEDF